MTQLPLWADESNKPMVVPSEPREAVSSDGVRGVLLDGVAHISIIDAYRTYGHSKNPTRDWNNDLKKLRQQGNSTAFVTFSFEKNGKRTKATPVVNDEQLARIAQVADFKEWEPIRQEMARLFVASKKQQPKQIPVKQSRDFLRARHSGYNDSQAVAAAGIREKLRKVQTEINAVRFNRGAEGKDFGKLNALDSEIATGKKPSEWKQERGITQTPSDFHSALQNALLFYVKREAVKLHLRNGSRGVAALVRDVRSLEEQVSSTRETLQELLSDLPIELPAPKRDQLELGD